MDHVTYALFHRTLSGQVDVPELLQTLDDLGVDSLWRDAITLLAPAVLARREGLGSPVAAIFINLTDVPNPDQLAGDWVVPEVSRHHDGAWPLALELAELGLVTDELVSQVREDLLAQGKTNAELVAAEDQAVADGFLNPR
jgi:hypothetical protein